jgi:cystathionine beta-synthase
VVVAILPDHGSRYMSKVFSDEWMENQGFLKQRKLASKEVVYIE